MSAYFVSICPGRPIVRLIVATFFLFLSGCAGGGPAPNAGGDSRGPRASVDPESRDPGPDVSREAGPAASRARDYAYDPGVALDMRIAHETRLDAGPDTDASRTSPSGVTRLDLSWASPHGGRVPAWLYLPTGPGPHSAIVLQHGMPGSRNTNADLAAEYARAGAIVLAPTAPFGRPEPAFRESSFLRVPLFDERDRSEFVQAVVDLRRAVDLLLARDDVDPGRIAYVGISYGGWAGAVLAGVERRITAYALVVVPTSLAARFRTPPTGLVGRVWNEVPVADREAWREAMAELDGRRFVGFASPARLLFQIATEDRHVPPDDAEALAAAASEPKTVLRYDADHALVPAAYHDQAAWLADILGLDIGGFVPPDYRRGG